MKFSLKIMFSMICLLSILFGIGGSLMITLSFNNSLEREKLSAYNAYQTAISTLQVVNSMNHQLDYDDVADTLEQLSEHNSQSWTALKLRTSEKTIYEDGEFDFSDINQNVLDGYCTVQYSSLDENKHFFVVSGTLNVGKEVLYMDMVSDISALIESQYTQQNIYRVVFLFLTVLCAVLSYSSSRILTRPLSELSKASRDISAGNLSRRADIKNDDEVGLVARDFNTMVENLENNIQHQERFIGSFAHEVKTPMTSIIGYADLIRGQTLDEAEIYEAANFIVSEGRRLESLSQKLMQLLVVRKSDIVFNKVDPSALIENVVSYLTPIYKKDNIDLSCECESGICMMDADLIKSLIINLCDNSHKALAGKAGYIHIQSNMIADGCSICISDNGYGIPSESLEHLTEAFYRVDKSRSRSYGGAGLGLALCNEIISLHNGNISFESEIGKGTTVHIEIRGGKS